MPRRFAGSNMLAAPPNTVWCSSGAGCSNSLRLRRKLRDNYLENRTRLDWLLARRDRPSRRPQHAPPTKCQSGFVSRRPCLQFPLRSQDRIPAISIGNSSKAPSIGSLEITCRASSVWNEEKISLVLIGCTGAGAARTFNCSWALPPWRTCGFFQKWKTDGGKGFQQNQHVQRAGLVLDVKHVQHHAAGDSPSRPPSSPASNR